MPGVFYFETSLFCRLLASLFSCTTPLFCVCVCLRAKPRRKENNLKCKLLFLTKMSLQHLALISIVLFFTTKASSGAEVKKAVGDEVSFKLDKMDPFFTSITWKYRTSSETIKVIEWEDKEIAIPNPRFKDITTLNTTTGQITIKNLKLAHSGVYTIDVSGKEQTQRFTLTVIERVPKPAITIEKSNNTVVYLICEYSETIIWKNSAGETLTGSARQPKGELLVVKKEGNPDIFYTCTLQNAVSEETSDPVYERDLFKEPVNEKDRIKDSNKGCVVAAVIPSITMISIIILFL